MSKNNGYWKKRQREESYYNVKSVAEVVKKLKTRYSETADVLQKEIDSLILKYASQNDMYINMAKKKLADVDAYRWRKSIQGYVSAIESARDLQTKEALLLELNTLAMQSRINFIEQLEGNIKAKLAELALVEERLTSNLLVKAFNDNYYNGLYKMQQQGIITAKTVKELTKNEVLEIVSIPWKGSNYSKRIWKRHYNIADEIAKTVEGQLTSGRSIDKISQEMFDRLSAKALEPLDKNFKMNVERLVQTEVFYARSRADLKVYHDEDIKEYEFIANLDEKTCPVCGGLDTKVFKVTEAVVGENYPPVHPRCGCTTGAITGYEDKEDKRKAKDKIEHDVPADMTYSEWREKYVEKPKEIEKTSDMVYNELKQHTDDFVKPEYLKDDYMDFESLELEKEKIEAFRKLHKLTEETGWEHAVIIDDGGIGEIFTSEKRNAVKFDTSKLNKNTTILHSHTNDSLLSAQDLSLLLNPNIVEIGNITKGKDVFLCSVGSGIIPSCEEFNRANKIIEKEINIDIMDEVARRGLNPKETNYLAIREQAYRIAREFKWTLRGGKYE